METAHARSISILCVSSRAHANPGAAGSPGVRAAPGPSPPSAAGRGAPRGCVPPAAGPPAAARSPGLGSHRPPAQRARHRRPLPHGPRGRELRVLSPPPARPGRPCVSSPHAALLPVCAAGPESKKAKERAGVPARVLLPAAARRAWSLRGRGRGAGRGESIPAPPPPAAPPRPRAPAARPGGGLVTAAASAAAADLAVFAGGRAAILWDSILICTGLAEPRRERARAGGVGGGQRARGGWGPREVGRPSEPEPRHPERRRHPAPVPDPQQPPAGRPSPTPSPPPQPRAAAAAARESWRRRPIGAAERGGRAG